MPSAVFSFVLTAALLATALCFVRLARSGETTGFDVALFLAPFGLWWTLAIANVLEKSLANILEPISLFVLLSVCFVVRTFAVQLGTSRRRAIVALYVGMTAALALYVFVPVLPE
jgi:uncharacterized protein YacL